MTIAVLADIHGNLPALEAVLADVAITDAHVLMIGGDVATRALPSESSHGLRARHRARFVRGNADSGLVTAFDGDELPRLPGPAADWCASQLSREHRDFLASFTEPVSVEVDGVGRVLFCHGSPRSDEEIITAKTPDSRLREFLTGVEAAVVVCGHTHMPFDRMVDGVRVLNPGSVGMPYGEPGAFWALVGPEVEFRRTDYDREAAAVRIRRSTRPGAQEFASANVASVPSVEAAMAFFRANGGP